MSSAGIDKNRRNVGLGGIRNDGHTHVPQLCRDADIQVSTCARHQHARRPDQGRLGDILPIHPSRSPTFTPLSDMTSHQSVLARTHSLLSRMGTQYLHPLRLPPTSLTTPSFPPSLQSCPVSMPQGRLQASTFGSIIDFGSVIQFLLLVFGLFIFFQNIPSLTHPVAISGLSCS